MVLAALAGGVGGVGARARAVGRRVARAGAGRRVGAGHGARAARLRRGAAGRRAARGRHRARCEPLLFSAYWGHRYLRTYFHVRLNILYLSLNLRYL